MSNKRLERWSPWILLVLTLALWQVLCSAFMARLQRLRWRRARRR